MNNVLVFHLDGSVEETVHEGTKNLWPVGTMILRYYGRVGLGTPLMKLNACLWKPSSLAYMTPSHRAFLHLMGFPQPLFDYIGINPHEKL